MRAANRFDDLWLLTINTSGPSATWTPLSPGGVTPPAQSAPCAAYDPAGRRLIVSGGETQDSNATNTTYQYLVDSNTWQLDTTTGSTPSARAFSACAWDPVVGRVVLYGGQSSGGSPIDGAYTYDPSARSWAMMPIESGSTSPGPISDAGAAYSPALGGMFMFGGRTATTTYTNQSLLVDIRPQ